MRSLWVRDRKQKYFEPFSQFWQGEICNRQWREETTPSALQEKGKIIDVCFVTSWTILIASPNAGLSFRQVLVPLQTAKPVSCGARM